MLRPIPKPTFTINDLSKIFLLRESLNMILEENNFKPDLSVLFSGLYEYHMGTCQFCRKVTFVCIYDIGIDDNFPQFSNLCIGCLKFCLPQVYDELSKWELSQNFDEIKNKLIRSEEHTSELQSH